MTITTFDHLSTFILAADTPGSSTGMSIAYYTVMSLFVFSCFLLLLLVLIQKGRGGGLAGAFGGGGGHTPFGTKTGDVLTWATSILFGVFLLLAIILNLISNARQKEVEKEKAMPAIPASTMVDPHDAMRHPLI